MWCQPSTSGENSCTEIKPPGEQTLWNLIRCDWVWITQQPMKSCAPGIKGIWRLILNRAAKSHNGHRKSCCPLTKMARVFTCKFMRVNILIGFEKHHHTKKQNRHLDFKSQFPHIELDEKYFHRKSCKKRCWRDKMKSYLESYSQKTWLELNTEDRK